MFKDIFNYDGIIVWLFNIGVENQWHKNSHIIIDKCENKIVNHIEEILFMIADRDDYVVLRKMPDDFFLKTLERYGINISNVLVPSLEDETLTISELILKDELLLKQLQNIAQREKVYLIPYGISENELKIANVCNLNYVGGDLEICKKINNKIYSRKLAEECGFSVTEGAICSSASDVEWEYKKYSSRNKQVIIKQPYGASGNGLYLINSEDSFKSIFRLVKKSYKSYPDMKWLVECWYPNKIDYNYQILISPRGDVNIFSIKKQLLNKTVYKGSLFSTSKNDLMYNPEIFEFGKKIAKKAFDEGYNGVLGVDAIRLTDGEWIPVIEINARFTLSTYISFLEKQFPEKKLLSFYHKFYAKISYKNVIQLLEASCIHFSKEKGQGVLCYTAETLNISLSISRGRAFFLVVANTETELKEYYEKTVMVMKTLSNNNTVVSEF